MSRHGSPRVSEDSVVIRARLERSAQLDLLSKQEYEDYKLKPVELAFKDLEHDVSQFREKPRLLLSEVLHNSISDDKNKTLYLHLAFTAAYAPFSRIFHGPHGKNVIDLDYCMWLLSQPPLSNYRIGKIMLLRLIMLNFWDYVVGEYVNVVEAIVKKQNAYVQGEDCEKQEESRIGVKKRIKGLFESKRKKRIKNWRQFDVTEIEKEAKQFAETEFAEFLRLFRFIVNLRAPSVEQRLLRYLEPKDEDYVVLEDGRKEFARGVSWKVDKKRRKNKQEEADSMPVNSWWTGTGDESM
ncbi:hypothetical protein BJ508DRAFT_413173, partial [Ascobolus immersus RN42]